MKHKKLRCIPLTDEEMKAERIWPLEKTCAITAICPDGHKVSCQAVITGENTCKKMYADFGGSGTDESGSGLLYSDAGSFSGVTDSGASGSGDVLVGISCGNTVIHCEDRPTVEMDRKVRACLYHTEWSTCTFLDPEGNIKGGYCRYGDPADTKNPYRSYLYCSDLGIPSRP